MTKDMITKVGIGIAGAVLLIGTALGIRKATKKYVTVETPSDEETGKEEQKEEAEG